MKIEKCMKEGFCVIGKEGSTNDGAGFVQALWQDANGHFDQVASLAKKDEQGNLVGIWGAMSDLNRRFLPWEDGFSRGLYLAGVECDAQAEAPDGWVKWMVPGFEYLRVEADGPDVFPKMMAFLQENSLPLAGAVHDFTCPVTGKNYMYFPIRKL